MQNLISQNISDTNTAAADLAAFLARNDYGLTVIGLPKTVDNDVVPIRQSLGAWTAADVWQSADGMTLLGNVLVWVGIPYVVIHLMLRWMNIHADLSNLTYLRVLVICMAAA